MLSRHGLDVGDVDANDSTCSDCCNGYYEGWHEESDDVFHGDGGSRNQNATGSSVGLSSVSHAAGSGCSLSCGREPNA